MLLYRDLKSSERTGPPEWLLDQDGAWAPELYCREDANGRLWGIGDAYMVGPRDGEWQDLAGGWQVLAVGKLDPDPLRRKERWVDVTPVEGLTGIVWMAPVILTITGARAFRCAFGRDFLPSLTPRQQRLTNIAKEARESLEAAKAGNDGVVMTIACQWAAELLAGIYFLAPEVIAAAGILDEVLTVGILSASAALPLGAIHD